MDLSVMISGPPLFYRTEMSIIGYAGERPFKGRLSIDMNGIRFDPTLYGSLNKMIGIIYPSGKLNQILHTDQRVPMLALGSSRFLELVDRLAMARVLVRIQGNRLHQLLPALSAVGFQLVERTVTREEFRRLATAEDLR